MTSRPARPRTLSDFINRPILKGVAPAGNLKRVFTGKSGQNRKNLEVYDQLTTSDGGFTLLFLFFANGD